MTDFNDALRKDKDERDAQKRVDERNWQMLQRLKDKAKRVLKDVVQPHLEDVQSAINENLRGVSAEKLCAQYSPNDASSDNLDKLTMPIVCSAPDTTGTELYTPRSLRGQPVRHELIVAVGPNADDKLIVQVRFRGRVEEKSFDTLDDQELNENINAFLKTTLQTLATDINALGG